MLLTVLLGLGLTLTNGVGSQKPEQFVVPLKYSTRSEHSFNRDKQDAIFVVNLDCPNLVGANVIVCAEMPQNWDWSSGHYGFVYMELYKSHHDIGNVSAALNVTYRGHKKDPLRCASVESWPGGDLYIKVYTYHHQRLKYTIGAEVKPPSNDSSHQISAVKDEEPDPEPVPDDRSMIYLKPAVTFPDAPLMQFDTQLMLVMDICAGKKHRYRMQTTVLSNKGTFSHYICNGPCNNPDELSVVCKTCNTGYVACVCEAKLQAGQQKVFVLVHASNGDFNATNGKYEAIFKFGAVFGFH